MAGTPVWLASLSRRSATSNRPIPTGSWSDQTLRESEALLLRTLNGVGNLRRERLFRMTVSLCLHRALSDDEIAKLPDWFWRDPPTDLAGGPVQILRETEAGELSTQPCHDPKRVSFEPTLVKQTWIPIDCEKCPPCLDRLRIMAERKVVIDARMAELEALRNEASGG